MEAQSHASVPPAPAWMSTKQFSGSASLLNIRRNSSCLQQLGAQGLHVVKNGLQARFVALFFGHVEELGVVSQVRRQ
jgi:hypothetical protein